MNETKWISVLQNCLLRRYPCSEEWFCHGRHDPRLKLMRKPNYYMTLPRYATLCTAKNRSDSERRKLLTMYQRPLVTPTADGAAKSLTRSTMKWRNDSSWIPGKLTWSSLSTTPHPCASPPIYVCKAHYAGRSSRRRTAKRIEVYLKYRPMPSLRIHLSSQKWPSSWLVKMVDNKMHIFSAKSCLGPSSVRYKYRKTWTSNYGAAGRAPWVQVLCHMTNLYNAHRSKNTS